MAVESPSAPRVRSLRGAVALLAFVAAMSGAAGARQARWDIVGTSLVLAAASVARLRSHPPPATSNRLAGALAGAAVNAGVLAVAVGLSALAAEGAMRWVYRDVTSTADFRGYFTSKWMRAEVRHNHYDYRGPEFAEAKPDGVFRVAVLGDSFTYGNGLKQDERFSDLVGAAVRDRGIEVLNFGFPGNNWPEHVRTLERRVLRLRPDFVLLQWGINDVEMDEDVASRPMTPPLVTNRAWHEWLYARSALYTILNAQWIRLQLLRSMGDTYDRYMVRLYGDPASPGARRADTLMRRFLALARERGVAVGLVLFPEAAVDLGPGYAYQFLHDRVAAVCREEGLTCVDLLPAYRQVPDRMTLWVTPLDSHPSALANRLAADAVLSTFAPRWGRTAGAPPAP